MASKLIQKREELRAKQKALADIFEAAGPEYDLSKVEALNGFKTTADKAAEIKRLNDELTAIGVEVDNLVAVEQAADNTKAMGERLNTAAGQMTHPTTTGDGGRKRQKSLGELFVESATYKERKSNSGPSTWVPDVDLKVLMTTVAGWAPEVLREPGYVAIPQVKPTLLDLIPMRPTSQSAISYMLETVNVSNAAERAEGANNAGEAQFTLAPQLSVVQEIAEWVPVTREQMDDVAYVQSYLNDSLTEHLRRRLNTQVAVGNGAPPNLLGVIANPGINAQLIGADPVLDCLYKGMVQCETVGGADADAFALHPLDYQDIRLTRTVDGVYILGNPAEAGPARIWGLPVVTNAAITQGTGLVGAWRQWSELAVKQGIQFEYTDSHAALFIQRTLAVLASIRVAFTMRRPSAFTQCVGI